MALHPPQHPWLPPKPEPTEYNHRHGNKSGEPRRRRDPGNRSIEIPQNRNTQQDMHRADDAALAGGSGSIVLCVGLDALGDDLAAELLVRILRDLHIDARHLSLDEVRAARPASSARSAGCSPGSPTRTHSEWPRSAWTASALATYEAPGSGYRATAGDPPRLAEPDPAGRLQAVRPA